MVGRRFLPNGVLVCLIICSAAVPAALAQNHPVNDAPGFQQHRDYFSEMPFEHIDTLTGSLVLTFTDLVLPGDAGHELRFQRTYNSKGGFAWNWGIAGIPLRISNPASPPIDPQTPQDGAPALLMSDGGVRKTAFFSGFDVAISSDFWIFDRTGSTRRLKIPNGDVCDYEAGIDQNDALRVSSCTDAFGNQLAFVWDLSSSPHLTITQHVAGNTRTITVMLNPNSANPPASFPISITFDGNTWTYDGPNVTPPVGPGWSFGYEGSNLTTVTNPHGGVITYTYENIQYEDPNFPSQQFYTNVVTQRATSEGGNVTGTWQYKYQLSQTGISGVTKVLSPTNRTDYTHGVTPSDGGVFDGQAGLMPLVHRVVQKRIAEGDWEDDSNWEPVEREDRTYTVVPVLSSGFGSLELETQTITRYDGATETEFETSLNYSTDNFGDYHHPMLITETGTAGTRSTVRSYVHKTTPYVLALPLTESVTVSSQSFNTAWTYNSTGFKTSETIYGITTLFTPDSYGNVQTVTKANNKTTALFYQYGQPRLIRTPEYAVTRTINADGSVASETRGGRTTTFSYDDLGRLTGTQPPGGTNATVIEYDNDDGAWVRTKRGASGAWATTTLDGFGRRIQTVNKVGVTVNTVYDAEGRVIKEGYPFKPGDTSGGDDIWTAIEYDVLGRVISRTNHDSTASSREYGSGGVATVTDEEGHSTVLTSEAFGNPDESRLASVTDADSHVWSYSYNALGRLVNVHADDGIERTWVYNTHDRLASETHPESGQTNYTYDAAGVLLTKTDAKTIATTITYDGNDRVKTITADNRVTTITYEAGTDNRATAKNQSAGTIWRYDAATGRLLVRQDAIDNKVFTTALEYDNNDFVTAINYPSGRRIQYDVDAEGRPTHVYESAVSRNYASSVTYHASGGLASFTAGNGITTTIAYDGNRYWPYSINSGAMQLVYGDYDNVGNPLSITDSRQGFNQTFGYDALDRLTSATGPYGSPTYAYDRHGNRSGASYSYETGTLRLSSQDTTSFTYDNNGNTLTAGSATYTYTAQNQLATSSNLGVSASYGYDLDEQRVIKSSGGSSLYYLHGLGGELLTEWKDPGTAGGHIRDYIYLGTRLLSAVGRNSAIDPGTFNAPSTVSHRYATSWQVPSGSGESGGSPGTITAAARTSSHPDMPRTGLRLGVQTAGWSDSVGAGPLFPNGDGMKQAGLFVEFEVERYPYTTDAEWLSVDGGGSYSSSTDDLRLYLKPNGTMVLKHDGARQTPQTLWTSAAVGQNTRHTLELRFEYNASSTHPLPNPVWENLTSWVTVYFDGAVVATYGASEGGAWGSSESAPTGLDVTQGTTAFGAAKLRSPGPSNGLLMNVSRFGVTGAANHGDTLDSYGSTWRTTLLEAAGPGTYSQWTGGQPDWRARSSNYSTGSITQWAMSNVSGQKISYLMESMVSRGITGSISTVLVGVRMGGGTVSANTKAFILHNGVETTLTDLVLTASTFKWYRVAAAGWAATDTVEIGVTCGANSANYLAAVGLIVEHNTPEPAPLTETAAQVVTVNYSGNGGAQTIDFGVDQVPTVLWVMPATGVTGTEPMWWWDSRLGASTITDSTAGYSAIWPQKGKFHAVHFTSGNSYNANGVSYVAIALFDPAGRYAIPFALSKPAADDNYTVNLHYPESGDPATDFTPDFVFGALGSGTGGASVYRGPGHLGDLTGKIGQVSASASDADRIHSLGAGTVQFGTLIGQGSGDQAFWAGRVNDGISSSRLMAVTSYTGNGTSSRNISLSLNGSTPKLVLVVPTNATAKIYRVNTDTAGRNTASGGAVANTITALAANQFTVGTALNANGVTYDVWAITTGYVTPF